MNRMNINGGTGEVSRQANIVLALVIFIMCVGCVTSKPGKQIARKVEGKTYVIVGASSGIGRGVAQQLGAFKANVVLAARRTALLDSIAAEIRAAGGKALVVTMDISKPDDVQRLAAESVKAFGKVDVWINNTGVGAIGRFWEIPLEDQARVIDVNLKGIIYGSYAAIKIFQSQGYGILMNTGSVDSETPLAYQGSYSASKAGVRSLGQALNQELRLNGNKKIKVVTIMPWAIDTPWWRHAANYSGGTPRMAALDGPQKVVNAMVRSSLRRRQEVPVGWKAKGSYKFHHIFPHMTERMSANVAHKYQIKNAPPAPSTTGSIYEPMKSGTGVDDGVRQRIKNEKKFKKRQEK